MGVKCEGSLSSQVQGHKLLPASYRIVTLWKSEPAVSFLYRKVSHTSKVEERSVESDIQEVRRTTDMRIN